MNPALSCIEDTLRLLLEEAKEAKAAKRGTAEEGFDIGKSEALTQVLHTWANQLANLRAGRPTGRRWEELRAFLSSQGY